MTAHVFNLRVYWEDTDAGGLVYHANYLKFAERARTEMLRHLGIQQEKLRDETGMLFVVRRLVAEYLLPARLDDELAVATRVKHLGGASLDLDQEVRRDDRALVRLALRIACLDRKGRAARLPTDIATAFASLNEIHITEE
jgi:acyl-CoA thioester hydrolase